MVEKNIQNTPDTNHSLAAVDLGSNSFHMIITRLADDGSIQVIDKIKEKASQEGSDITLETVRCLGMCDISPALLVNGIPYGGADAEAQLEKILG